MACDTAANGQLSTLHCHETNLKVRSRTVRRRDVSALVVANVLYEKKCF